MTRHGFSTALPYNRAGESRLDRSERRYRVTPSLSGRAPRPAPNIAMKLTGTGLQGSFVALQARASSLSQRWTEQRVSPHTTVMQQPAWSYPAHQIPHAVVFSPNTAFAAVAGSRLVAVATDSGVERWRTRVRNTWGWMALSQDTLAYLAQHSTLGAFEVETGEVRWTRELGGIQGWLHASEGYLVVGGWRGYTDISCINSRTGRTLWVYPARGKRLHSTALVGDGHHLLIADTGDATIRLVELATGREMDSIEIEPDWLADGRDWMPGTSSGSWNGIPQATYLSSTSCEVIRVAVEPLRGEAVLLPEAPASIAPSLAEDSFVFVAKTRNLWSGRLQYGTWTNHGPVAHYFHRPLPALKGPDGTIVIGTSEGLLYHFHAGEGSVPSSKKIAKRIFQQPAISGGHLCVAADSGQLWGWKWEGA